MAQSLAEVAKSLTERFLRRRARPTRVEKANAGNLLGRPLLRVRGDWRDDKTDKRVEKTAAVRMSIPLD